MVAFVLFFFILQHLTGLFVVLPSSRWWRRNTGLSGGVSYYLLLCFNKAEHSLSNYILHTIALFWRIEHAVIWMLFVKRSIETSRCLHSEMLLLAEVYPSMILVCQENNGREWFYACSRLLIYGLEEWRGVRWRWYSLIKHDCWRFLNLINFCIYLFINNLLDHWMFLIVLCLQFISIPLSFKTSWDVQTIQSFLSILFGQICEAVDSSGLLRPLVLFSPTILSNLCWW